jgi:hypothetical protein
MGLDLEIGFDCPSMEVGSSKRSNSARVFLIVHLSSRNTKRPALELTIRPHEAFNITGEDNDEREAIDASS